MMMCIIYLYKREKKGRNFCNELFICCVNIHDNKTRLRSLFLSLSLRAEDDAH